MFCILDVLASTAIELVSRTFGFRLLSFLSLELLPLQIIPHLLQQVGLRFQLLIVSLLDITHLQLPLLFQILFGEDCLVSQSFLFVSELPLEQLLLLLLKLLANSILLLPYSFVERYRQLAAPIDAIHFILVALPYPPLPLGEIFILSKSEVLIVPSQDLFKLSEFLIVLPLDLGFVDMVRQPRHVLIKVGMLSLHV